MEIARKQADFLSKIWREKKGRAPSKLNGQNASGPSPAGMAVFFEEEEKKSLHWKNLPILGKMGMGKIG